MDNRWCTRRISDVATRLGISHTKVYKWVYDRRRKEEAQQRSQGKNNARQQSMQDNKRHKWLSESPAKQIWTTRAVKYKMNYRSTQIENGRTNRQNWHRLTLLLITRVELKRALINNQLKSHHGIVQAFDQIKYCQIKMWTFQSSNNKVYSLPIFWGQID